MAYRFSGFPDASLPGTEDQRNYEVPQSPEPTKTPAAPKAKASRSKEKTHAKPQPPAGSSRTQSKTKSSSRPSASSSHEPLSTINPQLLARTHPSPDDMDIDSEDDSGSKVPGDDDDEDKEEEEEEEEDGDEISLDEALEAVNKSSWLSRAVAYLRTFKGHELWKDMLQASYVLSHPVALTNWISNKQKPEKHTAINPSLFNTHCSDLFDWWYYLQPDSRRSNKFDATLRNAQQLLRNDNIPEEEWGELFKGSVNGMYGVLVCLAWWMDASPKSLQRTDFDSLINDVNWVMAELLLLPKPDPVATAARSQRPSSQRVRK
ncbi:hypothetical protein ONZ45_g9258 [Pleurotus djamor]|nr:hypothetical protein ONZ45_g9258 [Pleurotus djamor]